jgi:hypothetical protein
MTSITPSSQRTNNTQAPGAPERRLRRLRRMNVGRIRRVRVAPGAPYLNRYLGRRRDAVDASVARDLIGAFNASTEPNPDDINPSTGRPYSWAPLQDRTHPGLSDEDRYDLIHFRLDD